MPALWYKVSGHGATLGDASACNETSQGRRGDSVASLVPAALSLRGPGLRFALDGRPRNEARMVLGWAVAVVLFLVINSSRGLATVDGTTAPTRLRVSSLLAL